ncbi:Uncharacterized protein ChrSV_3226 [Chromobacterium vaccinii]|nr:Uncharacterized protein ChrSW_3226 [Chromobacterium vaccinii]QND90683.1 Uncharacterized protein ChrSV_3226 [Chromobacterium vaccinii]
MPSVQRGKTGYETGQDIRHCNKNLKLNNEFKRLIIQCY